MATVAPVHTSDAVVVRNTWRGYEEILEARGDRSSPLFTFLDGRLTIVSPGLDHESTKMRLAAMLVAVFKAMGIPFLAGGAVTLRGGPEAGPGDRKGCEPDLCYYLRDLTPLAGRRHRRGKGEEPRPLVMGVDPPPHLAIEVAVSHDPTDQLAVLHHHRVPEVWVCRAEGVQFLQWAPAPACWEPTDRSVAVPCLSALDVTTWLDDPEDDDAAFLRRYDAWVERMVRSQP